MNHSELLVKPEDYARAKEYISKIIDDRTKALFVVVVDSKTVGFAECYILKTSKFPVIKKREWVQLDNIAIEFYSNKGFKEFNKTMYLKLE